MTPISLFRGIIIKVIGPVISSYQIPWALDFFHNGHLQNMSLCWLWDSVAWDVLCYLRVWLWYLGFGVQGLFVQFWYRPNSEVLTRVFLIPHANILVPLKYIELGRRYIRIGSPYTPRSVYLRGTIEGLMGESWGRGVLRGLRGVEARWKGLERLGPKIPILTKAMSSNPKICKPRN